MENVMINRFTNSLVLSGDSMNFQSELPTNKLNIIPFLNLKNESNYILEMFTSKPVNENTLPFMIVEPFESISFLLPVTIGTEGIYFQTRLIGAEAVKSNLLTLVYSDVNLMWCEKKNWKQIILSIMNMSSRLILMNVDDYGMYIPNDGFLMADFVYGDVIYDSGIPIVKIETDTKTYIGEVGSLEFNNFMTVLREIYSTFVKISLVDLQGSTYLQFDNIEYLKEIKI